ncbi:MAG: nascent polypeptide-associated complex protein [Candidatus Aenigmarchaeota archaeon]|nr:nascent polypeptide-associated complex protein [Candidatus Aenigmarchaeota archaeon]
MKINPKQIEQAMKKMGIKTEQVDAEEVIIRCPDKEIVIASPQVSRVNMMGQDTFQVAGEVSERRRGPSPEDVKMVMEQAGVSDAEARKALEETGDIAESIMRLRKEQ